MASTVKSMRDEQSLAHKEAGLNAYAEEEEHAQESSEYPSRSEIMDSLGDLGVNISALDSLSMDNLQSLLNDLGNLVDAHKYARRPGRPKSSRQSALVLSTSDKKIMHQLFSSQGSVSCLSLSKSLDIPISTIQRRRKRLETSLIEHSYSIRVEKLGWRAASLFVSTVSGNAADIGKEILRANSMVTSVTRILGDNVLDLRADMIFKTNMELVSLIEHIKSIEGVKNVIWGESVELIGRNNTSYEAVINSVT